MKKNIFSAFRHYTDWRAELKREAQEKVINFLKKDYELTLCYNIVSDGMWMLDESIFKGVCFDAILSNIPPSGISTADCNSNEEILARYEQGYRNTLEILRAIRDKASSTKKIPIIAYTSASLALMDLFAQGGVDRFVSKRNVNCWQIEAREIKDNLDSLLS